MFCTKCGLSVAEGNRFCQNCGQEVGAVVPSIAPSPTLPTGASFLLPTPYAGFWLRFCAYLIDSAILGIPFLFIGGALMFLLGGFGLMMHRSLDRPRMAAAFIGPMFLAFFSAMIFFMVLHWLYFASMESSERQATFGKSIMSLRVTDTSGGRLTFAHATGRFFAKFVSGLIPLAIGYIMAGFTEKKQALHDLIAGTLVMHK